LLFNKSSGKVANTGGKRIEPGSESEQIVLRWLEAGAPADSSAAAVPIGIEVFPARAVFTSPNDGQRIVVRARLSDGSDRDVTRFTVFLSNNDAAVAVDEHGLAVGKGPGEAFILARFDKFTSGVPIIVSQVPSFAHQAHRTSIILIRSFMRSSIASISFRQRFVPTRRFFVAPIST
jgi:hypothetical protein